MRNLSVGVCGVVLLAVIACGGGCGKSRENITMAGSTAFQPFAEKLADQYMTTHPDVTITIQGGGSALGIQAALSGAAQVGMADLVTLPPEAAALKNMVVARDGIAVVLNPANAVTALTLEQVRNIFCGKIAMTTSNESTPLTKLSDLTELAKRYKKKKIAVAEDTLTHLKGIGPKTAEVLIKAGMGSIQKLAVISTDDLTTVQGIGLKTAEKIIEAAKAYIEENTKKASVEAKASIEAEGTKNDAKENN